MLEVRFSERFLADVSSIYSDALVKEVMKTVSRIAVLPEMGKVISSKFLLERFDFDARKVPVGPFDLLYVYDEGNGVVKAEALIHQRQVR